MLGNGGNDFTFLLEFCLAVIRITMCMQKFIYNKPYVFFGKQIKKMVFVKAMDTFDMGKIIIT